MINPSRIIVMKVGLHLGEAWESIVPRKLAEERVAGVTYWGYGGSVCHPITQVQPFASRTTGTVEVLMIRTQSAFFGDATPATASSRDGATWEPIPSGVMTTGRYALTLRSLRATTEEFDLAAYEVGIGAKEGIPLTRYLLGRVDKACARLASTAAEPRIAQLVLRADLVPPYAVVLKSDRPLG